MQDYYPIWFRVLIKVKKQGRILTSVAGFRTISLVRPDAPFYSDWSRLNSSTARNP